MRLKDEVALICVNAVLRLKLGTLVDVLLLAAAAMATVAVIAGARFIVSMSRRTRETAPVGGFFRGFDLLALFRVAYNDRSRFDDGRIRTAGVDHLDRQIWKPVQGQIRRELRKVNTIARLSQINSLPVTRDRFAFAGSPAGPPVPENNTKKTREGPMTTAGQALLSAGELLCLSFAVIALLYFADKLRSGFLGKR